VPTRLDEFGLMEPSNLFMDAGGARDRADWIDEVCSDPFRGAVPLNIREAVLEVDWPWPAVKTKAPPIPQLEYEDVRSRTDLEDDIVLARTVDGTCRNREVVMLSRSPGVYILMTGNTRVPF